MRIGKYEFKSKEQVQDKIEDLQEGSFLIVELGHIILKEGEYELNEDEEMQLIKKPVFSDKYHVDVIWYDIESHPYGWKTYSCDLDSEGMHEFSGIPYLENKI
tara:strand:- start:38 stop:346 length:309 start_codon:yes stop_codon:yes gene_type:complete